jgi:hypothetical protein
MTQKQKRELQDDYMLLTGLVLATGLRPTTILKNARMLEKLQSDIKGKLGGP